MIKNIKISKFLFKSICAIAPQHSAARGKNGVGANHGHACKPRTREARLAIRRPMPLRIPPVSPKLFRTVIETIL